MKERRHYIRINKAFSVSYRVLKDFLTSSSHSRNISEGGICLPIYHRFEPGVVLALKIAILEFNISIKAIGEVVWFKEVNDAKHPFWVGIKFVEISDSDQNKLRSYIDKVKPADSIKVKLFD